MSCEFLGSLPAHNHDTNLIIKFDYTIQQVNYFCKNLQLFYKIL